MVVSWRSSQTCFQALYVNNLHEILAACVNRSDAGWTKLLNVCEAVLCDSNLKLPLYDICVRLIHVGNKNCSWLARLCDTHHDGKVKVCIRIRPDRSYTKYFYSPLSGMLVHRRATQALNLLVLIYTPGWRGTVRYLGQEQGIMSTTIRSRVLWRTMMPLGLRTRHRVHLRNGQCLACVHPIRDARG